MFYAQPTLGKCISNALVFIECYHTYDYVLAFYQSYATSTPHIIIIPKELLHLRFKSFCLLISTQ